MFDVDLYTPRGAAGSCHAIFRVFQKMNSISISHHCIVAPARSHGSLLSHWILLSHWVWRSTRTQHSILSRDRNREHHVRILSLCLAIRAHDFRVIGLSSPVKSIRVGTIGIRVGTLGIRVGTIGICAPVAYDAKVFAKRRCVETLKH